jgi:hypothetical protein
MVRSGGDSTRTIFLPEMGERREQKKLEGRKAEIN